MKCEWTEIYMGYELWWKSCLWNLLWLMAWSWTGYKPLPKSVMTQFTDVYIHLMPSKMNASGFSDNCQENTPDSKVHGANMGPIWGRQDPGGPHVGPMNFVIWDSGVHIPAVICWCPFIVYLLEINVSHITGYLWGESTSNQWFTLRKDQWNIYLFLAWRSCWKNWKLPMIWDTILLMWHHSNE